MNSPITITEIGRRLGVSAMTVSNVLNHVGQQRFASKAQLVQPRLFIRSSSVSLPKYRTNSEAAEPPV